MTAIQECREMHNFLLVMWIAYSFYYWNLGFTKLPAVAFLLEMHRDARKLRTMTNDRQQTKSCRSEASDTVVGYSCQQYNVDDSGAFHVLASLFSGKRTDGSDAAVEV